MKLALVFLFSFYSLSFSGSWSGRGEVFTVGWEGECKDISLGLELTKETFRFIDASYSCENYEKQFDNLEYVIEENRILFNGQIVGVIKEKEIELRYREGAYTLYFKFLDDGSLDFRELDVTRTDFVWVEGNLSKVEL